MLGRRHSPSRCQITHRDHKASLQITDDISISFLCPPRTARRSRAPAGCCDTQIAVTQGHSKLSCAVELSKIRFWYLSKEQGNSLYSCLKSAQVLTEAPKLPRLPSDHRFNQESLTKACSKLLMFALWFHSSVWHGRTSTKFNGTCHSSHCTRQVRKR